MLNDLYKQYTEVSYAGKKLLEKHSLIEVGAWQIKGEDPNADLHGSHHQPDLGLVTGRLNDVIRYAVGLPNFWQWGAGGDIISVPAPKQITPTTNARREELKKQIAELETDLKSLKAELDQL